MLNKIENLYREMKKSYLGDRAALVPGQYWSQFVCLGSASDWHYRLRRLVPPEKKRVLIVGVHGGRDYFYFKSAGYDVTGLDLFPDLEFGNVAVGDIETADLPDRSFDCIVASAVIEHVNNDYGALRNIRRMLKDDGIFILGLPLYNDWEVTHLHIYSRESTRRLLRATGFRVEEHLEYPTLFIYPSLINAMNHALNAVAFLLFRKTFYASLLPPLWKLEYFLSRQHSWSFRAYRSFLGSFDNGVFMTLACRKGEVFDQAGFNRSRFDPSGPSA